MLRGPAFRTALATLLACVCAAIGVEAAAAATVIRPGTYGSRPTAKRGTTAAERANAAALASVRLVGRLGSVTVSSRAAVTVHLTVSVAARRTPARLKVALRLVPARGATLAAGSATLTFPHHGKARREKLTARIPVTARAGKVTLELVAGTGRSLAVRSLGPFTLKAPAGGGTATTPSGPAATGTTTGPGQTTTPGAGTIPAPPVTTPTTTTSPSPTTTTTATTTTPGLPPNPASVAPPDVPGGSTDFADSTSFLYTGSDPIQTGVAAGAISSDRASVVRGSVQDASGDPLSGVTVTIHKDSQYGQTLSRADGEFDMAVNGGGALTVQYSLSGYLPVQRTVTVSPNDYAVLPTVVMLAPDPHVTQVTNDAGALQAVLGSQETDSRGTRQNLLVVPAGTTATATDGSGATSQPGTLAVRITEFTVGASGPDAMPGSLPPSSAYTYAYDLSADGYSGVHFSQPVYDYTTNFLSLPVGWTVPNGSYDTTSAAWDPDGNGVILKILSEAGGVAAINSTATANHTDTQTELDALHMSTAELRELAVEYPVGQELWRAPVTHFSAHDFNYAPKPVPPVPPKRPQPYRRPGEPKDPPGIIDDTQASYQQLNVGGTPFQLEYHSDQQPGYLGDDGLEIPLPDPSSLPASVTAVTLKVSVAGQVASHTFTTPYANNSVWDYQWNGKDAYGRSVQGAVTATVTQTVTVNSSYCDATSFGNSCMGGSSGGSVTANYTEGFYTVPLGSHTQDFQGLGGWGLSILHSYDAKTGSLYNTDDTQYGGTGGGLNIARGSLTVFGGDYASAADPVDGQPATSGDLATSGALTVAPDGSLYFIENETVRRIAADGTISTIAGNCTASDGLGDGGPATAACLGDPSGLAFGPDGTLYIADYDVIWHVSSDGTINSVAGGGTDAGSPDSGPALNAQISPRSVAVATDGTIYIAERCDIRRVAPDGSISLYAGQPGNCGFPGDTPAPAIGTQFDDIASLAVAPDGGLYVSDNHNNRIREIDPSGQITTVAGAGTVPNNPSGNCLTDGTGNGGPATEADLDLPGDIAVGPDGGLYIADTCNDQVREVIGGVINAVVGCTPNSASCDRNPNNTGSLDAAIGDAGSVAVASDGTLYSSDGDSCASCDEGVIWKVANPEPGPGVDGELVPSPDGTSVYRFDTSGREVADYNALTGDQSYSFSYGADGQLASITDANGQVTRIDRDPSGEPTAIVAPGGQVTTLDVDADGELTSITDPANQATTMQYADGGLLTSYTDADHHTTTALYDSTGRLTKETDPDGGFTTLGHTNTVNGFEVTLTDSGGRVTTLDDTFADDGTVEQKLTDPAGGVTDTITDADATETTYPDGSIDKSFPAADPRFGLAAPYASFSEHVEPDGTASAYTQTRQVTLSDPANPLSVVDYTDLIQPSDSAEHPITANPAALSYDASGHTLTLSTPAGASETYTLNGTGQVVSADLGTGLAGLGYSYNSAGFLTGESAGGVSLASASFDPTGNESSSTDGDHQTTQLTEDADGQLTQASTPMNELYGFIRDATEKVTQINLPGGAQWGISYNGDGLVSGYSVPGGGAYSQTYDVTHSDAPSTTTLPSGAHVTLGYDSSGRPTGTTFPEASYQLSYSDNTDNPATVERVPTTGTTNATALTWNGDLPVSEVLTGATPGEFDLRYDQDTSRLTDIEFSSPQASSQDEALSYNDDGLLTGDGPFTIDPSGPGESQATITDGSLTLSLGHDSQDRVNSATITDSGGGTDFAQTSTRDGAGLVSGESETVGQSTDTFAFGHDADGRLDNVSTNGSQTESYGYDGVGDRLAAQSNSVDLTGAYTSGDVLTAAGSGTYSFNADGFLTRRGADTFTYSAVGELLSATVGGANVSYDYDGFGRQIARTDATGTTQFFYGNPLYPDRLTDSIDSSGTVTQYFYDADGLLYGLTRNGDDYMVGTDDVGTPLAVIDDSGNVVEQRSYDAYGRLLSDSDPSFGLPLGYAGGIEDPLTGLVRFGARDYDPGSGRFTAIDPALMAGGLNPYEYAGDDPVSQTDLSGEKPASPDAPQSAFGRFVSGLKSAFGGAAQDAAKAAAQGNSARDAAQDNVAGHLVQYPADEYRDLEIQQSKDATDSSKGLSNVVENVWHGATNALGGGHH